MIRKTANIAAHSLNTSPLGSASWSPDGRRIADAASRIWTVSKGGREIRPTGFQPRRAGVNSVAWNPDGKRLASSGDGGVIRLWDADGTPGPLLQTNASWIPSRRLEPGWNAAGCCWRPRGNRAAMERGRERGAGAAGTRMRCKRCRLESGRQAAGLCESRQDRSAVGRGWDAGAGAAGSQGGDVRRRLEFRRQAAGGGRGRRDHSAMGCGRDAGAGAARPPKFVVTGLAWNPHGERLASAASDGTVRLWNKDGSPGPVLTGNEGRVLAVAWSPDGKRLASANEHGTVRLWDADGTPGLVLRGHEGEVRSVAWSGDGVHLASAGSDTTLRVWDAGGETEWMAMQLPDGNVAVFSAAGELLHGDPDAVEKWLVYLVEEDDGHIAYLQPSEFRERLAAAVKGSGR